jgi:rare lipoprotein A
MKFQFFGLLVVFFTITSFVLVEIQKGTASYYSMQFQGRKTSSGERFHNDSLTAAHKTLPFGTKVKITNLKNDSTVVVKINDRLSQKSSRIVDVTVAAAKKLNFIRDGITKVSLETINE